MTKASIIQRAKRLGHIKDGFVICDNCDTPADLTASIACGWTGCAPCIYGEAEALDASEFIFTTEAA